MSETLEFACIRCVANSKIDLRREAEKEKKMALALHQNQEKMSI